jgi:hypothetical protein
MTRITVPWENQNNTWWTDTCTRIIDHFGLPGGKYNTEVSAECMHFDFHDDREALMCRLLISDSLQCQIN